MKIAVFCGSGMGLDEAFIKAAKELGDWIGSSGHSLVYGGGDSGLMGIVAASAFDHGTDVIGIVPGNVPFIMNRPQPYVTELVVTDNMSERKQKMFDLADAFIALPGGIGTIDEMAEAITLTKIGVFDKKCVMMDVKGFYQPFKEMILRMESDAFLREEEMKHVLFSDKIREIEVFLDNTL